MEELNNEEQLNEKDFEKMKKSGISQEEIDNLKYALDLANLSEHLPEDADAFMEKVDNYFPDDPEQALKKYFELAETDPEFLRQLFAFQEFVGTIDDSETKTLSQMLQEISNAQDEDEKNQLTKKLIRTLSVASKESRDKFSAEVKQLTLAEKQQLANILKK